MIERKNFMSLMLGFCLGLCLSDFCSARVFPAYYQSYKVIAESARGLVHISLELNGRPLLLRQGATVQFVRGDSLKILGARLKDGSSVESVNLVGFNNYNAIKPTDDRNYLVDTSKSLNDNGWSVDKDKSLYIIIVTKSHNILGWAFIQKIEPQLSYIDIELSKEPKVLREGGILKVKSIDDFKLKRIVTNLDRDDDISFKIVKDLRQTSEDFTDFQMQVIHKDKVFSSLVLRVDK